MRIETTLGELDETIYKYDDLLGWAEGIEVQEDDETLLAVTNYRVQIPSLGISVRPGTLYTLPYAEDEDEEDPDEDDADEDGPDEDPWEPDSSIALVCELDEKDPAKYISWSTSGLEETVYDHFWPKYRNVSDLDDIPCFIDSSDFMEDEEEARKYAAISEENYEKFG